MKIETWHDVIANVATGVTQESVHLEFKAKVDATVDARARRDVARELARDICQFANGDGGVLLIGVAESRGDGAFQTAAGFCSVEDGDRLKAWFEQTVRYYLSPSDLSFDAIVINSPDDATKLLAVNVPPYEGLAAVWHSGEAPLEYPWRTSLGKRYLNPMEAQERMTNRTRAIEIRARRVLKKGSQGTLASGVLVQHGAAHDPTTGRHAGWSVEPRAPFCVRGLGLSEVEIAVHRRVLSVPFGLITEVWSQSDGSPGLMLAAPLAIPNDNTEAWIDVHGFAGS